MAGRGVRASASSFGFYQRFRGSPSTIGSLTADACPRHTRRPGPRRRLRRPVRPAHRPAGARAGGVLRDRPQPDHRRRGGGAPAGGADPVRRPEERPRRRARRRSTRRSTTSASRSSASATAPSSSPSSSAATSAAALRGEYGRAKLAPHAGRRLLFPDDAPDVHDVWMSHFDADHQAPPPGFTATADDRRRPGRRARGRRPAHLRRAVPPRGRPLALRHGRAARASSTSGPACPPTGRWRRSSTSRSRASGPRSATAGSICALSGGVDSSVAAALVHRAIGHQLTCIYVDTGLMRKGESDQVTETFRREHGHRADPRRRRRPLLRPPRRGHRPGGQAQGDRRRVHPHLRGAHRRPRSRPSSSSRARSTPTSSSRAAPTARPR